MTASKPETESGDSGRDGSHTIWSLPVAEFRTKRVTAAPWAFSAPRRAAPIGPEAPLTRMRIGLMAAACASTLADWVEPQGSGDTSEDARVYMEPGRCGRASSLVREPSRSWPFVPGLIGLPRGPARYNPAWRPYANSS